MKNKKIEISITGYKYAPEQFKAYYKITTQNKNIPAYIEIDLTQEQKQNFGYQLCTNPNNAKKIIAQIKHDLRQQKKKTNKFVYGFATDNKQYAFINDTNFLINCNADLKTRFLKYKEICKYFDKQNWQIENMTMADLNGYGKIENITKTTTNILKNKLLRVYNKSTEIYI